MIRILVAVSFTSLEQRNTLSKCPILKAGLSSFYLRCLFMCGRIKEQKIRFDSKGLKSQDEPLEAPFSDKKPRRQWNILGSEAE